MNILGLVASERKLGNSEILAKEILSALPGNKRLLRLSDLTIASCRACYACLPAGKPCILNDDLTFFLDQITWADVVVLASPCYFLGAHTSVKTIGDRLISVLNDGSRFRGKRCVTVVSYGVENWDGYAREMLMNFARFLHLDVAGSLTVRAANPGEAASPAILEQARQLAGLLAAGQTAPPLPQSCPGCASSLLQLDADGHIRCVMCGATGQAGAAAKQLTLCFDTGGHSRFSAAGMAEHGQRLEEIKREYGSQRRELLAARKPYQQMDEWWVKPGHDGHPA
ncbi:MAG: flavodoxin family protein [Sporomusaceae bacterium]|nr:flavodoxin family protein [Sporomusaceae bacterium]